MPSYLLPFLLCLSPILRLLLHSEDIKNEVNNDARKTSPKKRKEDEEKTENEDAFFLFVSFGQTLGTDKKEGQTKPQEAKEISRRTRG